MPRVLAEVGKSTKNVIYFTQEGMKQPPNMTIEQILEFVKTGLSNAPYDEHTPEKKVRVKEIKLLNNNNVVCEFFPYAQDSIGIKTEIGFILDITDLGELDCIKRKALW